MQQLKIFIIHPSDRLTDHLSDGDGLVAYGYLKQLADRGHLIYIAAREVHLAEPLPDNVKIFKLKRCVKLPILDRIEYTLRARRLFGKLNRTVQFDLLQQMNPVFVGLSLAFVGCKVPVCLGTIVPRWPNDSDSLASQYPAFRKIIEWVRNKIMALQQRHASALLLSSRAAINKIPEPERVSHKMHFLPLGMDAEAFSPCLSQVRDQERPSILFLGSLIQKKGIYTLIDAYLELRTRLPEVRLLIAGGGLEEDKVAQRVRGLGAAAANVSLLGRVNRATALDLMQKATVFCQPSFGEPYGNSLVEAMSCARAIVATDAGGIPELLPRGGGILVPPGDSSALAAALQQVLEQDSLRQQMGAINRKHVEENLTWAAVVNRLESIYSIVLAQSDPKLEAPEFAR